MGEHAMAVVSSLISLKIGGCFFASILAYSSFFHFGLMVR
jgi:hypothetical protein